MLSENKQRAIYLVSDLLATAVAWFVFNYIRFITLEDNLHYPSFSYFLSVKQVILGQILFPLGMLGIYWVSGFYNNVYIKSRIEDLTSTLASAAIGSILIYFAAIVDDPIPDRATNYELLLMLFGLLFICVYAERLVITGRNRSKIQRGDIWFNALLICNAEEAYDLKRRFESGVNHSSHGYRIVGAIRPSDSNPEKVAELINQNDIKAIIIEMPDEEAVRLLPLINRLLPLDVPILVAPSYLSMITAKPRLKRVAADPLVDVSSPNIAPSTANLKRLGDFLVAMCAAISLIPVYVIIAVAIKCDSRGPIIYRQTRIGRHRKPFRILKFRTMVTDSEPNGPCLSSENDPRITRVGKILRKYRLDELPQFFNVIGGSMSLVGPRPEREYYISKIMEKAPYYTLLHCVRPGITSLGMVKHGYATSVEEMINRMHYDMIYIENVSFTTDLKIIAYTVATVFSGKGF